MPGVSGREALTVALSFCRLLGLGCPKQAFAKVATLLQTDNPDAAERFGTQLTNTFETLATMPNIGITYLDEHQFLKEIRRYPVKHFEKYLVFYRKKDSKNTLEIVRILHGARDLPMLFN